MSEPTREQPAVTPEVSTRSPWHVSRIPAHLGRARTSTVVLTVLFLAIFALYLYVKPDTTAAVTSGTGNQVPASPVAPAPETTAPTTTPEPTQEQPTVSPEVTTRSPWHVSRIPAHLGRARTSTVVLAVLFVAIFALYLNVKPAAPATVTTGTSNPPPAATTAPPRRSTTPSPTPQTTGTQSTRTTTAAPTTTETPTGTSTTTPSTTTSSSVPTTTPSLPTASVSSPTG